MEFFSLENGWTAFLVGLVTSPHCLVMCGPLAYVMLSGGELDQQRFYPYLFYNFARVLSFTLLGILAGVVGLGVLRFFQLSVVKYFPWVLVVFLLVFALGLDRLVPKFPFARRLFARFSERVVRFPKNYAALLLGFTTPFLPCGPLYMVLWVALLSGSPGFGGEVMLGFALGTLPLMLLSAFQFKRLRQWLKPDKLYFMQRLLAVCMVFFIAWRILANESLLSVGLCCPW